ncbi:MAG: hypothetical protein Q8K75_11495 [Chlamydiales bacterium]|nr:hypothetical protein [Chlamydiales bacterium]
MQSDPTQNNARKIDYPVNEVNRSAPAPVPSIPALPVDFPDMPIPLNFSFLDDYPITMDLTDSGQFTSTAVDLIRGEDRPPIDSLRDIDKNTLEDFLLGLQIPLDPEIVVAMPEEKTLPATVRRPAPTLTGVNKSTRLRDENGRFIRSTNPGVRNEKVTWLITQETFSSKPKRYGADKKAVEVFRSIMKANPAGMEEVNAELTKRWNIQTSSLILKIEGWSKKIRNPDAELQVFMNTYCNWVNQSKQGEGLTAKKTSAHHNSKIAWVLPPQEYSQYADEFKREMERNSNVTVSQIDGALSQLWGRSLFVVRELIKSLSSISAEDQKLQFLLKKYWTEVESTTLNVIQLDW